MSTIPSVFTSRLAAAALATCVVSSTAPAAACGGFFCSASAPVEQTAERIIFAQDQNGDVTQIVEVLYEGPAEKFSWILPVPGVPEPSVSSKQVFDRLQGATDPQYYLQYTGGCYYGDGDSVEFESGDGAGSGGSASINAPSVTVLDSGSVGPFDYETISVDAADQDPGTVAVEWLTANGYDPGPMAAEVLGPYLANGLNLIAFRLEKGASSGSIRPIVLEYNANAMAIPIRPTAVAAADDMPVLVWVLSEHQAVPTNYRSLEINELLIDWFNPRPTYDAVVTAAANEAGGQGFVTELSGPAALYKDSVAPTENDLANLFGSSDDLQSDITWMTGRLGNFDGYVDVVRDHVNLRDGITAEEFVSCPDCYFYPESGVGIGFGGASSASVPVTQNDPIFTTDMVAFEAAVMAEVIQPLLDAGALMEQFEQITRLYTTMSASEMNKDPVFEQNPDLPNVSNQHMATHESDCGSNWTVTLADGTKVYGTGFEWPYKLGDTELPVNARILQYSTSGGPEIVLDNQASILAFHRGQVAGTPPTYSGSIGDIIDLMIGDDSSGGKNKRGCVMGITSGSGPALWLALLGAGLWIARRKRKGSI